MLSSLLLTACLTQTPPNIVLILADDMGASSHHAANSASGIDTPHLDRLASEGMSFTDAHSGSAVCSPTRYGLLTGRYSWRTRMKSGIVGQWGAPLIKFERSTLADLLRDAGYSTACIGKWHLGWNWPGKDGKPTRKAAEVDYTRAVTGGPLSHGFDVYFGDDVPNWPPYVWIEGNRTQGIPGTKIKADGANGVSAGPAMEGWSFEAVLPAITRRCVETIEQRAKAEQPFFLFFSMTSPHTPINPSEPFQGKSGISRYADFLVETDASVGALLEAIDRTGTRDETLVIFTADNGTSPKCDFEGLAKAGADLKGPWRGHKADIFEGGHRVPFLVRWPGVVKPASTSDEVICLTDVYATVADAVGKIVPENAAEDSISLLPILQGEPTPQPLHDVVVHHSSQGYFAVRAGRYKLAFCRGSGGWSVPKEGEAKEQGLPEVQLYDLRNDPGELHNLADERPELVASFTQRFRELVGSQVNDGTAWWPKLPWKKPGER